MALEPCRKGVIPERAFGPGSPRLKTLFTSLDFAGLKPGASTVEWDITFAALNKARRFHLCIARLKVVP